MLANVKNRGGGGVRQGSVVYLRGFGVPLDDPLLDEFDQRGDVVKLGLLQDTLKQKGQGSASGWGGGGRSRFKEEEEEEKTNNLLPPALCCKPICRAASS